MTLTMKFLSGFIKKSCLGSPDLCPSISTASISCAATGSCISNSGKTSFSLVSQSNSGIDSFDARSATEAAVNALELDAIGKSVCQRGVTVRRHPGIKVSSALTARIGRGSRQSAWATRCGL